MDALGPWPRDRAVAVAVSGGADSTALALLAAGWAAAGTAPLALIVDHGLRPESAAVAFRAAARVARFGLRVAVLRADGLAPGGALQERARDARSVLLARACREAGLVDLLLGHHGLDQDETIAMRRARGTGPVGGAGMSAVSERGGLRLLRPLLGMDPGALRGALREAGIDWEEDPANADPRFERARLRARTAAGPPAADGGAAASRRAIEASVRDWCAANVAMHEAGFARLAPGPVPPEAFSALLRTLSGQAHPPRREAVLRLASGPRAASLHGVRIVPAPSRLGGGWLLLREQRAMRPPVPLDRHWDGRFRVAPGGARPEGWTLGAVGAEAAAIRAAAPAGRRWPAALVETLPCLRDRQGRPARVPHLGFRADTGEASGGELRVMFCPTVPLGSHFFTS